MLNKFLTQERHSRNNINFFGKNWQCFIERYFNEARLEEAKKSLVEFLGREIKGRTFIDAGCGSGLFSLSAHRLGASQIMSFDIDEYSVKCCEYLWKKEGCPENWHILKGSILDGEFLSKLGKYDIVYSWGVLHHTRSMWEAARNTLNLVNEGGFLYIAIYNKVDSFGFYSDGRFGSSCFWERIKRSYSHSPLMLTYIIDYFIIAVSILVYLVTFQNPVKKIKSHQGLRGMSWITDIKDWLGGYPYEYATVEEVSNFVQKFGFSLKGLKSHHDLRNNEYLFRKS